MVFLTKNDFYATVRQRHLDELTESNDTLLDQLELVAMHEVESYLRQRYDVTQIWAQSGSARDPLIVQYLVDIVLYHLHSAIDYNKVPELRVSRHDVAIQWLTMVAKGQISPNLPQVADTNADEIRWGSEPKLGHSY